MCVFIRVRIYVNQSMFFLYVRSNVMADACKRLT